MVGHLTSPIKPSGSRERVSGSKSQTGQVRWRSLEVGQGLDKFDPPGKCGGGTRLVW
jgi:hypothetical protein